MKKINNKASLNKQKRAIKNKKRQQKHPQVSKFEKQMALKRLMIVKEYLDEMKKNA